MLYFNKLRKINKHRKCVSIFKAEFGKFQPTKVQKIKLTQRLVQIDLTFLGWTHSSDLNLYSSHLIPTDNYDGVSVGKSELLSI